MRPRPPSAESPSNFNAVKSVGRPGTESTSSSQTTSHGPADRPDDHQWGLVAQCIAAIDGTALLRAQLDFHRGQEHQSRPPHSE